MATHTEQGHARKLCRERHDHQCWICQSIIKLTVHHKVPLAKGGTWEQDNLVLLCDRCHKLVHGFSGLLEDLIPKYQKLVRYLQSFL